MSMKNPWQEIQLDDYENHMKLDSVMQLQTLNSIMKEQFVQYPVKTIMILGVAGGNGLEHINPQMIEKVFGVDINPEYLQQCAKRYTQLGQTLHLCCADLTKDHVDLPHAELVVANLLIEYIGCGHFQKTINHVAPQYVSCVIQVNTDASFVSESPYAHVFDRLDSIHHSIDEKILTETMRDLNYHMVLKMEIPLPNGKKLVRLDFKN